MKRLKLVLGIMLLLVACNQSVVVTESHLPIVYIDTQGQPIPDDPKIEAHMGIINHDGTNRLGDSFNGYDGPIGIELRGSSSQYFAKKQYGLETWDAEGEDNDVELLGLPEESDWILYGAYNDKTLIRNSLAYQTARDLGHYASRQVFVELFLNGQYEGVYILFEKIKRDKNRVDISKVEDGEITGGYLLEFQCGNPPDADEAVFQTDYVSGQDSSCVFIIDYPSNEDLTPERKSYIQTYVNQLEQGLYSTTFTDPETGYAPFIDRSSFIDYMLLNEIFKNTDVFYRSTFFYKDVDDVLKVGPAWDFDLSLGNDKDPHGFLLTNRHWASQLLKDPNFSEAYIDRYLELRQTTFSNQSLNKTIDDMVTTLGAASDRNFKRWPVLGTYIWPNRFIGNTYQSEIAYLKDWLETRLAWIDAHLGDLQ
jgi:spore coat protein CotH